MFKSVDLLQNTEVSVTALDYAVGLWTLFLEIYCSQVTHYYHMLDQSVPTALYKR